MIGAHAARTSRGVLAAALWALVTCQAAIPVSAQTFSSALPGNPGPLAQAPPRADVRRDLPTPQPPQGTIIPTDVLTAPTIDNRLSAGENLQLRILQTLPARFYFSGTVESSFRLETNPFQFPTKRQMTRQLPQGEQFFVLPLPQRQQVQEIISLASREDVVFRVLPNATAGWTVTPRTRAFVNYFMISDTLFRNHRLNTVIHSLACGLQQDFPVGNRANIQAEMQFRELWQLNQPSLFDFLPGLTGTYVLTPRTVAFTNVLLQLRGRRYFRAPTREIDPFYTWGALHQRGGWTFSASSTLVQNFREPFRQNASIPANNYAFILDFEIARRLFRQFPGLQAFVRAEPIYNFKSNNRPGLAGMDFRLFWGLRVAAAKPSLLAGLEQLRQQIEEQEAAPPAPSRPSAQAPQRLEYQYIAHEKQPIHPPLNRAAAMPQLEAGNNAATSPPSRGALRTLHHPIARSIQIQERSL